jgi:hypothetical protein
LKSNYLQNLDCIVSAPDPKLSQYTNLVEKALARNASAVTPESFRRLIGDPGSTMLRVVMESVKADSMSIWIADLAEKNLVVTHTEPDPKFVGWVQPLTEGLSSFAYASEQSLCENQVSLNATHSTRADEALGQVTAAMIATPLYFGGALQGVISCVQLKEGLEAPDPDGFSARNMNRVRRLSTVLERLVNYRLITELFGLEL